MRQRRLSEHRGLSHLISQSQRLYPRPRTAVAALRRNRQHSRWKATETRSEILLDHSSRFDAIAVRHLGRPPPPVTAIRRGHVLQLKIKWTDRVYRIFQQLYSMVGETVARRVAQPISDSEES